MLPIDMNTVKCRISEGCFYALGSFAKYKLEKVSADNDAGTDFRLIRQIERNGKVCDLGSILEFQLKASQKWSISKGLIRYKLSTKAYNDIVSRNLYGGIPLILVLMTLPKSSDSDWIKIRNKDLLFKNSLFWYYIDSKDLLGNENSTKTIEIPISNVLSREAFDHLVLNYSTNKTIL